MSARIATPMPYSEPSAALAEVERAVMERRSELLSLFERSPVADRIFAVDRLLRDERLSAANEDAIVPLQVKVREAWSSARAARIARATLAQRRHELDLTLAERALWALLTERGLFDLLFSSAESYVRVVPRSPSEPSFRDLLRQRDELRRQQFKILPPVVAA